MTLLKKSHKGPYDIVFSSPCLENPCQNLVEYIECMKKLASLVKGEWILHNIVSKFGYATMYNIALKSGDVIEAIQNCSLQMSKH